MEDRIMNINELNEDKLNKLLGRDTQSEISDPSKALIQLNESQAKDGAVSATNISNS